MNCAVCRGPVFTTIGPRLCQVCLENVPHTLMHVQRRLERETIALDRWLNERSNALASVTKKKRAALEQEWEQRLAPAYIAQYYLHQAIAECRQVTFQVHT